jgi:chromosomal replication initiator protein
MNSPSLHPTQAYDLWTEALQHTRSRSPATFEQWFSSIQFDGFDGEVLRLSARDEFVRDWVRDHFLPTLLAHLRGRTGDALEVIWSIEPQLVAPVCPPLSQTVRRSTVMPSSYAAGSQLGSAASVGSAASGSSTSQLGSAALRSPSGTMPGPSFAVGSTLGVGAAPTGSSAATRYDSVASYQSLFQPTALPGAAVVPDAVTAALSLDASFPTSRALRAQPFAQPRQMMLPSDEQPGAGYNAPSNFLAGKERGNMIRQPISDPPQPSGWGATGVSAAGRRSSRPARAVSAPVGPIAQLNAKYTFENFVVGSSNELAYAAAFASAGGGGPRYNPLFIAGGTGLGKTHLMHAIAHKVLKDRPDAQIVYVSAELFTNEFIEALQNHRMDEFRARYRSGCDVLLVDDIQFLAGREQTQEEFFHTFNALHDAGVPIIVTSDKYPQQLQRMPERLVSRFTSGLVADVQAPQLETRVAILKKKAQLEGIDLPDSVAVLLAQNVKSNVRELEGSLIRLAAKASLTGRSIDDSLIQGELAIVTAPAQKLVGMTDIQRVVCNHFRVTNTDLLSKDRHKSVAFARQVAMYLCRQRLKSSFPELGRAFGNRDHTTVMSAVRRVESLRKRDPQVNAHLEEIERRLATSEG